MADVLVESTPNENALKYTVVGKHVLDKGHKTYSSPKDAEESPIASTLFQINGVTSVFLMADFITVTKQPEAKWDEIQGRAKQAIQDAYG